MKQQNDDRDGIGPIVRHDGSITFGPIKLRELVPLRIVCAWCPGFNAYAPENVGASHGICATCAARVREEMRAAFGDDDTCPACEGSGEVALRNDSDDSRPCPQCGGTGTTQER